MEILYSVRTWGRVIEQCEWDGYAVFTCASAYLAVFGMDFQHMVPQCPVTIQMGKNQTKPVPPEPGVTEMQVNRQINRALEF